MSTIANLVIQLTGDISGYQSAMGKAESMTKRFGSFATKTGMGLTLGLTLPILGAGAAAVDAASDMNESMSKVNVVFGQSAQEVIDWSKTSDKAMGLTQQQALESAGTFGNLFDAMGITEDSSVDMSTSLIALAGDLASFNNIDPTEALEKLRSGIVGETEPMRALGVNLLETAVQEKALAMGLAETTEELTFQDKVLARYNLIMEQTKNAQGDFARTADGLANSQRILKAEVGNLAVEFGEILLPYVQEGVRWVSGLVEKFMALDPGVKQIIVGVLAFAAVLGPLLVILGMVATAIGAISAPMWVVIAVLALLALAWKNNWGGIRDILTNFWETKGKVIFEQLKQWLAVNIPIAIEKLKTWWDTVLVPALQRAWAYIQENVIPILLELWNWLKDNVPQAIEAAKNFFDNVLVPALQRTWDFIQTKVLPILLDLWNWLQTNVPAALQTLANFWDNTLKPAMERVWAWMNETLFPFLKEVNDFIGATFGVTIAALALIWETGLKPALETVWEFFKENILPILNDVWDFIANTLGPAIGTFITESIEWLTSKLQTLQTWLEKVTGWFWKLYDAAKAGNDAAGNGPSGPKPKNAPGTGGLTPATGAAFGGPAFGGIGMPVGERGWEWFIPQQNGYILNHADTLAMLNKLDGSGAAPVTNIVNYNVTGSFMAEPEGTITEKLRILHLLRA